MCGRARLSSDLSEIKLVFGIPPERPTPNIAPSWSLAPTDPAPVVHYDAKAGSRALAVMRWGLIPYWAKDIKIGFSTINARAEEVDTKPAFREAFRQRRCLVPLDSFCEWKKIGTGKQPYAIALADRRLMGMAGLWETWRSPAGREFAASPSSRQRRTSCAPSSTTGCLSCSNPKRGRRRWANRRPTCRDSRHFWPPTLPMK
jgi:putative SOS response-associated peptidase YedK